MRRGDFVAFARPARPAAVMLVRRMPVVDGWVRSRSGRKSKWPRWPKEGGATKLERKKVILWVSRDGERGVVGECGRGRRIRRS
jgi:hypothetical protein